MRTIQKQRTFSGTQNPDVALRETKHRAIARKAAAEGMVLLKNEGDILPLKRGCAVALYGAGASKTIKGGTGSGDVNERECISIYQGLKSSGFVITTEDWITEYDSTYTQAREEWRDDIIDRTADAGTMAFFEIYSTTPFRIPAGGPVTKTDTDTAIYVLSRVAGEGKDRAAVKGDYELSDEEHMQLSDICRNYEKVIVAVNAGGPVDLSFMDEFPRIKALLYISQPGMEGGNAFADVVSGRVSPCGKLTDTLAFHYSDYPSADIYSHNNGNVQTEKYEESIYVGYRYFDTFDVPVRYGFGYGLSYTNFRVDFEHMLMNGKDLSVTVKVTNTGKAFRGKEVVQIYASCPDGRLEKEYRRLCTFGKTKELRPGESQLLTMKFSLRALSSYDEEEPGWVLEEGFYGIWAGNSLQSAKPVAAVHMKGRAVLEKTKNICPVKEELTELCQEPGIAGERCRRTEERIRKEKLQIIELEADWLAQTTEQYKRNAELVSSEAWDFVQKLDLDKVIALSSGDPGKGQGGNLGAAGISVPGSAGETSSCANEDGLASIVLADGPAGLRLMKYYHVHEGKVVAMPFEFSLEGGIFYKEKEKLPGERYYQYCTAIPVGTLLAQTWDTELISEVGAMIGQEMKEFGVTLWLAPGMNIHRNPLCGRNFEYYSEDPVVAGFIAAAMTKGVQSVPGCGTTIKHFACNNQEDNRMGSNSVVSERALREIYLRGFELAVKRSQPLSIMTSYNLINGVHSANCYDLCTEAARNEWGFKGVIMTDWTTTEVDETCTASGCMRAGNDLVMPGNQSDIENIRKELEEGTLSEDDLRACVSRLVNVIWQSGWYLD